MANHVLPADDLRGHVEIGPLCPCLPRVFEDGELIVHNSYDMREVGNTCRTALDLLGAAHVGPWSDEMRSAYEHAVLLLDMHWPEVERDRSPLHSLPLSGTL